jgi:hypothetical protein
VLRMNDMRAAQQAYGCVSIGQSQQVHRRAHEFASPTFHVLQLFQLSAAAAAAVGAGDLRRSCGVKHPESAAAP